MVVARMTSRLARTFVNCYRTSIMHRAGPPANSILRNHFHSISHSRNKMITGQISLLHTSALNSFNFQRFGISSSASPHSPTSENEADENTDSDDKGQEEDLTMEDLIKLVTDKDDLLKTKQEEIEKMKDKVLRAYADTENIMDRTKRESENSKKFAIQSFAKSLLDVADNLDRASSVVKESFAKIDAANDTSGAVPLLKTLLEGVEMTEKQLAEVFKKFGVEKYDPLNEEFDPNRHNAVFQVPDETKSPDTVAVVLKAGYMLHDRIIRPAEVGVTIKAG
ncbi:grpE protein homolog 2, mitochondrial-like isoform X2 [Bidens hawaiensis]|uniref:grpE protein homolog 2, mitochondrial-like isoform X2 n=1 Tax=Bidens hawaiensis TaxID=980011 RepID=UPI00404AD779